VTGKRSCNDYLGPILHTKIPTKSMLITIFKISNESFHNNNKIYLYINEYEYKKYLCMISMTTAMMKSGLYYY